MKKKDELLKKRKCKSKPQLDTTHIHQDGYKSKEKMESVSKNVEKLEPLCIASRNENGEATVKKA